MDPKLIELINRQVTKKIPEVAGIKPTIRKQSPSESNKWDQTKESKRTYLLTYKFNARGPNRQKIPRWVRVVASPGGKILKITTSK